MISRRRLLMALGAGATAFARSAPGMPLAAQGSARRPPRPLSPDAVVSDWTSFLGPTHDAISAETKLSRALPPPLVWEFAKGTGYASPAVAGDRLDDKPGADFVIDVSMHVERRAAALRAHATQHLSINRCFFDQPDVERVLATEIWRHAWGPSPGSRPATNLFDGLEWSSEGRRSG